jgi:hypothetical protein
MIVVHLKFFIILISKKMFNQNEKCNKCGKMIIKSNHLLHESMCKGQPVIFNQMNNQSINSNITNKLDTKQQNEEFYHCSKCDMYFDILEKSDHLLSHQFEREIMEQEQQDDDYDHGDSDMFNSGNSYNQPRPNYNFNSSSNININNNTSQSGRIVSEQVNVINGTMTIKRVIQNPDGSLTETISTSTNGSNNNYNNNFNQIPNIFNQNPFVPMHFPNYPRPRISGGNPFSSNFIFSQPSHLEAFLQSVLTGLNPDHPVEEDILSSLPEIEVEDVSKLPPEKKDCVVCLNKYETKEKVLILPCTHMFHTECIKDWFKSQNTCPICKFKLDRSSLGSG